MKKIFLFAMSISFIYQVFGIISHHISPQKNTRQLIVHFTSNPQSQHEHIKWNQAIHEAQLQLNNFLIQKDYIQACNTKKTDTSFFDTIKKWCSSCVFKEFSSKYNHKRNEVFFTRVDHDFGSFTLYIPDGVPQNIVVKQLKSILDNFGLAFHIDKDIAIHIALASKSDIGLEGIALTLQELEALKRAQRAVETKNDTVLLEALEKKTKKLSSIKEQAFWHQRIPTTGLRLEPPFYPPAYPFIPHMFSLWQLAPKKGRGIKVAIIDTGVSAASFENDTRYKKNLDLTLPETMLHEGLNIVSHNGLDPIEQLVNVVYPSIDPQKFNEVEISQEVIRWIYDYLQSKKVDKIISYLKTKGKRELFDNKGELTLEGKKIVDAITTGPYGIDAHQGANPLTIATMQEPYNKAVIQQLIPVVPISNQNITYIAGHGSHTYGLVAASLQKNGNTPENDTGVCGIAPEASVFMIKAFKDDGTSDKSTLIAALKKAIFYNADIVNLSLKIADSMDLTASLSKLLEKMVGLIPYVVAASGNGGDPYLRNYVGSIVAYPARFDSVAFDVGSFGCKNMKCSIDTFSQYEKNIGPKFVAPGFNILSSALIPNQKEDSMYVFMDGTSMAAPIMTGFVALMLAEFQKDFTREEMLSVCYTSVFRMHNNTDWNEKVLLGVLDMRTALFVLHVLQEARKQPILKNVTFNKLLTAIYEIIYAAPNSYGKSALQGADFTGDFMTYFERAQQNLQNFKQENYFKIITINDAIQYVINSLLAAYNEKQNIKGNTVNNNVLQRISTILKANTDPDIFGHLKKEIKNRITISQKKEDYWQDQAKRIRNEFITRKNTNITEAT